MPAPLAFIAPEVGAALIGGISSILGGVLGGKAKSQAQKQQFDYWKKMLGERHKYLEKHLKPKTPYYATQQYLPQFDKLLRAAILGQGQSLFGDQFSQWGLNEQDVNLGWQPPVPPQQEQRQMPDWARQRMFDREQRYMNGGR